jgi:hypothetical protein
VSPSILGPRRGRVVRGVPAFRARGTMRRRGGDGGCKEYGRHEGLLQQGRHEGWEQGVGGPRAVLRKAHRRREAHTGSREMEGQQEVGGGTHQWAKRWKGVAQWRVVVVSGRRRAGSTGSSMLFAGSVKMLPRRRRRPSPRASPLLPSSSFLLLLLGRGGGGRGKTPRRLGFFDDGRGGFLKRPR